MTTLNNTQDNSILDQTLSVAAKWLTGFSIVFTIYALFQFILPGLEVRGIITVGDKIAWYMSRSSGLVAYCLLTASTLWGLILSTKIVKELIPAPLSLAMHNYLSWTAIGLSLFHAGVLLFDKYFTYTLTNLLVPFTGPYQPGWVGLGIISLYLLTLISASFSWRKWLGNKNWRRLHYLSFGAYIMVTIHGVMAGTDSGNFGMYLVYAGSGIAVFFLTIYRILTAAPAKR